MPGRWSWPGTAKAAAVALGLTAASTALGQLLDLKPGATTPGVAGDGTATLIDHLVAEASRLRDELGRALAAAGGSLDAQAQQAFDLRIAARHRAADLLTLAHNRGDAGAPHALAALTLIARFDAFDAWAAAVAHENSGPTPAGDAALAFIAGDVDVGLAGDAAALDHWLARVLGPRAQSLGPAPAATWDGLRLHAGWIPAGEISDDPTALADLSQRWTLPERGQRPGARERRLSPEAAAVIRAFDSGAIEASDGWADAPGNARIEGLIRTAGRVMDGLEPTPPRDVADALAAQFDAACRALADDTPRAIAALERLTDVVALAVDTARAMSAAPRGVTAATKDLVWKRLWAAQVSTSVDDRPQRDALRRAIDALLSAAHEPGEGAIVREARPVLRRLMTEMEMAERELWTSISRPTSRNPMDDPGIVGSLATVRRLDSALRGLVSISRLLETPKSPPKARPDPGAGKVRERLIALAKDLERPASRDAALVTLLMLLDAGDAFAPGDAERTLRTAPAEAAWTAASAGKTSELLAALDAARTAALRSWGEAKPEAAAAIGRVRSLARLVELVHAGSISAQIARQASAARAGIISRHPGVELSGPAAAALLADLEPATARLVPVVLAQATRDAGLKEIDKLYAANAGVRLFAKLEAQARATDLADVDPAIELAAGPGSRPWLGERREDLALICWNAHELAAAQLRGDRGEADRRATQINVLAELILAAINLTTRAITLE